MIKRIKSISRHWMIIVERRVSISTTTWKLTIFTPLCFIGVQIPVTSIWQLMEFCLIFTSAYCLTAQIIIGRVKKIKKWPKLVIRKNLVVRKQLFQASVSWKVVYKIIQLLVIFFILWSGVNITFWFRSLPLPSIQNYLFVIIITIKKESVTCNNTSPGQGLPTVGGPKSKFKDVRRTIKQFCLSCTLITSNTREKILPLIWNINTHQTL